MTPCTTATHAAMKSDPAVWTTLKFVGIQDFGDGELAELRNCHCKSTLCRTLPVSK